MSLRPTRRTFVKSVGYASAAAALGSTSLIRAASPNGRLNIAFIGAMGQAGFSFDNLMSERIVAVADVDAANLDQRRELLRMHPSGSQDPTVYRDFRIMLDKEHGNFDAFVVATPDHQHAQAALRGMAMGKHIYCEKPLAHTVKEVRLMIEAARKHKLVTQMGTQIHSTDNYRRVVEKVKAGAVGPVREVHCWIYGAMYSGAAFPAQPDAIPPSLDWDLWLGPAAQRPYYDKLYHPFNWRGWWDFGGGGVADFGCHYMDLPFWALDLKHPLTVAAHGPEPDPQRCSRSTMVEWEYPARGGQPPIKLTWHLGGTHMDSGKYINVFEKYGFTNEQWKGNAVLFVGDKGLLISDYGNHKLLPEDQFTSYQGPPQTIAASIGHHAEWLRGIKEGSPTLCNFDYSGTLTESVLLGVAAHRAGNQKATFDAEGLTTNNSEVNAYLTKPYRKGWEIEKLA